MKAKIVILIVAAGLLALLALPAWAAYSENQVAELQDLYQQKKAIELEILEKRVEMGLLPEERAELLKERINTMYEARREAISQGKFSFGREGMFRGPDDNRGFGWKRGGCPMREDQTPGGAENTTVTY